LLKGFQGSKAPFSIFQEKKYFLQQKKVCQAAEGITAYKVKAPLEKTAKNLYFYSSARSI
jgi:hypothetical protein